MLAIALIALAAAAVLLVATRWGLATSSDSARYVRSARHALGLDPELPPVIEAPAERAHFPPGYSTALVLASLGGRVDPLVAARWLHALLLGANVVLCAELVRRFTGSRPAALFTGAAMAAAPPTVFIHALALSEPLFILLCLASLALVASHVRRPRRGVLVAAGVLAGLGVLTRYAGAATLPAGAAAVLLLARDRDWRPRIGDSIVFLVAGAALPLAWSVRNLVVLGSSTNRTLAWHPVTPAHLGSAARTFADWLLTPGPASRLVMLLATLLVLIVLGAGVMITLRRRAAAPLAGTLVLFVASFALLLAWSISLVDFLTPVDARILSPVHAAFMVLAGVALAAAASGRSRALAVAAWSVAVLLALGGAVRSAEMVRTTFRDGSGYAHRMWRESPTIAFAQQLPQDWEIYTNAPGAVYLLTRHPVIVTVPSPVSGSSRLPNPEFDQQMQRMRDVLHARRGALVYLERHGSARRAYGGALTADELKRRLGLHPLFRKRNDGAVFDYVPPAPAPASAPATAPAAGATAPPSPSPVERPAAPSP